MIQPSRDYGGRASAKELLAAARRAARSACSGSSCDWTRVVTVLHSESLVLTTASMAADAPLPPRLRPWQRPPLCIPLIESEPFKQRMNGSSCTLLFLCLALSFSASHVSTFSSKPLHTRSVAAPAFLRPDQASRRFPRVRSANIHYGRCQAVCNFRARLVSRCSCHAAGSNRPPHRRVQQSDTHRRSFCREYLIQEADRMSLSFSTIFVCFRTQAFEYCFLQH